MKKRFAKKSLGQNFLHSSEIRDKILEAAGDITGKNILEIGPGLGFLTTKLLAKGATITAVEIDPRATQILQKDFSHKEDFKLIKGDILQQNLDTIFEQKKYSIIANIPYNITAPILRKTLSETKNKPEMAILMVQKEVAQKITDQKKRSILSISIEIFAESSIVCEVNRECFSPIPKVDSAVIKLTTRTKPLITPELEKKFFTVVNAGFTQKRKKISNYLGGYFGISSQQLLGSINPNARAETLSIDDWILITNNFKNLIKHKSKNK